MTLSVCGWAWCCQRHLSVHPCLPTCRCAVKTCPCWTQSFVSSHCCTWLHEAQPHHAGPLPLRWHLCETVKGSFRHFQPALFRQGGNWFQCVRAQTWGLLTRFHYIQFIGCWLSFWVVEWASKSEGGSLPRSECPQALIAFLLQGLVLCVRWS